ncbi:MAG: hypothetical protein CMH13_19010 [Martelella sp.]|nr:hypothetical protein [Martelella sp.]
MISAPDDGKAVARKHEKGGPVEPPKLKEFPEPQNGAQQKRGRLRALVMNWKTASGESADSETGEA